MSDRESIEEALKRNEKEREGANSGSKHHGVPEDGVGPKLGYEISAGQSHVRSHEGDRQGDHGEAF